MLPLVGSDRGLDLRARDEILTLAEESAGIGVWEIDLTTGLARGTAQYFRIMGLEPLAGDIPIDRIRALRHPEDRERVVAGFQQALDSGVDFYEIEYRIVRPDGELRWIFGRGRVVRDADGRPVRYSGVDLDITERKRAEAALAAAKEALERMNRELEARVRSRTAELEAEGRRRAEAEARLHQAQKMEAVGQLTGGVAHDFNNLLQVIMGNLEIVRRLIAGQPARTLEGPIEAALAATRNAAQLTHRLLAFSRQQPLEPAVLDVNRLIGDMADMIAHTLGETITVETRLAADLWATFADRNQLESAFLNLVVNARDAMDGGGRLLVRTENVSAAGGDELPAGDYVALSVADSGSGIAPEHLAKVFDPFFTTKEPGKGSGLGLSMVYGFAQQSGGQVRIASELGRGTTVTMLLPRTDARPERAAARPGDSAEPLPQARAGETVLLVEDNEEVRRQGVAALRSFGYRVIEAADARSALAVLEAPDAPRVDLLFTDVVLPNGLSGRALADAVRTRRGAALPVLFTTGYARDAITHEGRLDPDVRLLRKPYNLDSLARSIRQAIDRG
ncbi:MAG TPA: ATP-binding protein [Burkholderiales bacterium]|nr:ATP-binding protein [Burkholderiales bacterium]